MAILAAMVASSPCPNPSTTANRTPSANGLTRCRSPETVCPGNARSATPHSTNPDPLGVNGFELAVLVCISFQPFLHRDGRPGSDFRNDVEIVHQQFRSGQTHAQPPSGG